MLVWGNRSSLPHPCLGVNFVIRSTAAVVEALGSARWSYSNSLLGLFQTGVPACFADVPHLAVRVLPAVGVSLPAGPAGFVRSIAPAVASVPPLRADLENITGLPPILQNRRRIPGVSHACSRGAPGAAGTSYVLIRVLRLAPRQATSGRDEGSLPGRPGGRPPPARHLHRSL